MLAVAGDAIVVRAREVVVADAGPGLVSLAVAVVIDQVARFWGGVRRIAGTQSGSTATPLSATGSVFAGVAAGGAEAQSRRALVAHAHQVRLDTLLALDAADADGRLTSVAARASLGIAAWHAAEAPETRARIVLVGRAAIVRSA